MPDSVLDAIKLGIWDYEPQDVEGGDFDATRALPGTERKLEVLAERLANGLPLWHSQDRRSYDESDEE